MNILELQKSLIQYYKSCGERNVAYEDKFVGDYKISMADGLVSITNLTDYRINLIILDTSIPGITVVNNTTAILYLYTTDVKHISISAHFGDHHQADIPFKVTRMAKYLPPGTSNTFELCKLDDITEEFIFQQSTLYDLPEYKYFDQFKRYHKDIISTNQIEQLKTSADLRWDWDNIPLTKDDFL